MVEYRWVPLGMMEACSHGLLSLQPWFIGCFFLDKHTDLLLDFFHTKHHFETVRLTGELEKNISGCVAISKNLNDC